MTGLLRGGGLVNCFLASREAAARCTTFSFAAGTSKTDGRVLFRGDTVESAAALSQFHSIADAASFSQKSNL
jgi:hypothetical protein